MGGRAARVQRCLGGIRKLKGSSNILHDPAHGFHGRIGAAGQMWKEVSILNADKGIVIAKRLRIMNIEQGHGGRMGTKEHCQSGRIDDHAARGVDQDDIGLHASEGSAINEAVIAGSAVDVDGEDVGLIEELLHGDGPGAESQIIRHFK